MSGSDSAAESTNTFIQTLRRAFYSAASDQFIKPTLSVYSGEIPQRESTSDLNNTTVMLTDPSTLRGRFSGPVNRQWYREEGSEVHLKYTSTERKVLRSS